MNKQEIIEMLVRCVERARRRQYGDTDANQKTVVDPNLFLSALEEELPCGVSILPREGLVCANPKPCMLHDKPIPVPEDITKPNECKTDGSCTMCE